MRVLKQCRECKQWKARDTRNFYLSCARDKDGYMGACKLCHNAYNAERRQLKRDQIRQKQRIYDKLPHRVEARRRYAQTPRGKEVARAASLVYSRFKRLTEQQEGRR